MRRDLLKAVGLLVVGALVYWLVTRQFHLQGLVARGAYVRVDAERHPYLLSLRGPDFTNRDLALLHTTPTLERVFLQDCAVDDDGIASIMRLPRLMELDLSGTAVTDAAMLQLARVSTLEALAVNDCSGVTVAGLEQLARLRELDRLSVKHVPMNFAEYRRLQNDLETVDVRASADSLLQLTPAHVWRAEWFDDPSRLCGTIRLSTRADARRVTAEDLTAIAWPEAIAAIDIGVGTALQPEAVSMLRRFPHIESLSIAATLDDDDFSTICRLPHLKRLQISSSTITDKGLERIPADAPLESLQLRTKRLSPQGLTAITRYGDLRQLDLSRHQMSRDMFALLEYFPELTWLTLIGCGLEDDHIAVLGTLPKLQYVDLRANPLTTLPAELLESLPDLRRIDLRNTQIPPPDQVELNTRLPRQLLSSRFPLLLRFWHRDLFEYETPSGELMLQDPFRLHQSYP
ncbi:MAG: leucine-rich repeat domain-containing protein [Maioricimonas sp. JB049]